MNGNKFLLDTNATLYILNGDITLTDFLFEKELYSSIITEMQLLSYKNTTPSEQLSIEDFLNDLVILNIDEKIKLNAITVKKSFKYEITRQHYSRHGNIFEIATGYILKIINDLELVYYEK